MRTALCAVGLVLAAGPLTGQQRIELPAADKPLAVTTQTLFTIGAADGEPWETFANVWQLAFSDDGNLYVLDTGNHRIVVFDSNGKYVRTVGRQGSGPGEFLTPVGLAISDAGEIIVNDAGRLSFQIFSRDGKYLRGVPFHESTGRATTFLAPSMGSAIFAETAPVPELRSQGVMPAVPPRTLSRIPLDGTAAQRMFVAPAPTSDQHTVRAGSDNGLVAHLPRAFAPKLLWAPLGGSLAATASGEYRVTINNERGAPERVIERPSLKPRKVTTHDKELYIEERKEVQAVLITPTGGRPGAADALRTLQASALANMQFEDVMPVLRELRADRAGRLWIQRSGDGFGNGPIDIVTKAGQYIGTLASQPMPIAFGPNDVVGYSERDETGVPKITVKRLGLP